MSTDIQRYIPLRTAVAYALDELDKSQGDFDKCWVLAFRALVDIYTNIEAETKTVRLPVDANLTVPFPPDLLQWKKIGVLNALGELATLKINRTLTKYKDNNPQRLGSLTPDVGSLQSVYDAYFLNYWSNGVPSHLFGIGGGLIQPGECTVDEKNRLIVLAPSFAFSHILLEYKSSPQKDADYSIDIFCQEAVIAFIKWKLRAGTEQEYYSRVKEARRKIKPVTTQEINQIIREGQTYKVKA